MCATWHLKLSTKLIIASFCAFPLPFKGDAPAYDTAREAFQHAVPIQYPNNALPQMSDVENAHGWYHRCQACNYFCTPVLNPFIILVFRMMILEIIVKNATNEQAINRACEVSYSILFY